MPTFSWEGVTRQGQRVSGQIDAANPDELIRLLRARDIDATKIKEGAMRGGEPPDPDRVIARTAPPMTATAKERPKAHPIRGLLLALGFFAVAFGVGAFSPVFVYDCERTPAGAVDCTLHERMWGLVTLREQTLRNVSSVTDESRSSSTTDKNTRRTYTTAAYRLVFLGNNGDSMRPVSWTSKSVIGSSLADVESKVRELVDGNEPARMSAWHLSYTAIIVTSAFVLLGLLMATLSILSFSSKFTERLQKVSAEAGEWARKRRESRE